MTDFVWSIHACRLIDALVEQTTQLGTHRFTILGALVRGGALDAAATVTGPDNLTVTI